MNRTITIACYLVGVAAGLLVYRVLGPHPWLIVACLLVVGLVAWFRWPGWKAAIDWHIRGLHQGHPLRRWYGRNWGRP